jgi:hypothetical protein
MCINRGVKTMACRSEVAHESFTPTRGDIHIFSSVASFFLRSGRVITIAAPNRIYEL